MAGSSSTSLRVAAAAVVLVAAVVLMVVVDDADAYSRYSSSSRSRYPSSYRSRPSSSLSSSFYRRYGSDSRRSPSPKARYVHSYGSINNHAHPHRPQAIGIPINVEYGDSLDLDNLIGDDDDHRYAQRLIPYGFGEQILMPIEGLLRDLAGYTGYTQSSVPGIVKNIKHEFYIGANKRDPYLHNILKRYGFMFTGNPSDLGMGLGGVQGGLNNILGSVGLGGNGGGGLYSNGGGGLYSNGVSSAQNPLPGVNGAINDDLFDDFGNGLLANTNTASAKQENTLGGAGSDPNDPLGLFG